MPILILAKSLVLFSPLEEHHPDAVMEFEKLSMLFPYPLKCTVVKLGMSERYSQHEEDIVKHCIYNPYHYLSEQTIKETTIATTHAPVINGKQSRFTHPVKPKIYWPIVDQYFLISSS